jgi:hypothetical protein
MMAKMFYTLDETKNALGKNEEEIKQFAREGRLREFRDGPRLMFKADQVEALKHELGLGSSAGSSGDQIDLGPSDTGAPIGLVDSRSASATGISLADTDSSARSGSSPGMVLKDDTALAADLGLSGSMGGVPSPGRPGSSSGLSGTRSGSVINVFSDTEGGADPSAQTAINQNIGDQVTLEGVGSGSGLLDLTRESDDTSLGAELLDEISPGASRRGSAAGETGAVAGSAAGRSGVAVARGARAGTGAPVYVEAADPGATAFGFAALAGVVVLLFGTLALFSAVKETRPGLLVQVGELAQWNFIWIAGGGLGLAVIMFIFGLILGRAGAR